jgi:hypothetical protein
MAASGGHQQRRRSARISNETVQESHDHPETHARRCKRARCASTSRTRRRRHRHRRNKTKEWNDGNQTKRFAGAGKGPADYFTGTVRIDPLFEAPAAARVFGASVTFEPGARTAWHTHPLGQTLIVTSGLGWVQRWGGSKEEIRTGRRDLVSAWREPLARRRSHDGHDAHRHR